MTHRMFSRNAELVARVPIRKMIDAVRAEPAMPIWWGRNQSGMQAPSAARRRRARARAKRSGVTRSTTRCAHAERLAAPDINLHKQLVNRMLEPFAWITVIITATEWANFFTQRTHEDAQPELKHIATLMLAAYRASAPRALGAGEWHTPLILADEEAVASARGALEDQRRALGARVVPVARRSRAITPRISSCTSGWSAAARTGIGRRSSTSRRRSRSRGVVRQLPRLGAVPQALRAGARVDVSRTRRRSRRSAEAAAAPAASRARLVARARRGIALFFARPRRRRRAHAARRAGRRADRATSCSRASRRAGRSGPAAARAQHRRPASCRVRRLGDRPDPGVLVAVALGRRGAHARHDAPPHAQPHGAARRVRRACWARSARRRRCRSRLISYRVGFNAGVTDERLPQWFLDYAAARSASTRCSARWSWSAVLALVDRVRVWYLVLDGALLHRRDRGRRARAADAVRHAAQDDAERRRGARRRDRARALGVPGTPVVVLASVAPQQRDERRARPGSVRRARASSAT